MKGKLGVLILACAPLAVAATHYSYPTENVGQFVVEKLDVRSFPPTIGPKAAKGKRTFGDYGYLAQKLDDQEAVLKAPQGSSQIAIHILEQSQSGIYVCVRGRAQDQSDGIQRVYLLKATNGDGLLKAREASKQFQGCPVIGETSEASAGD
jgi:hypothetical protein